MLGANRMTPSSFHAPPRAEVTGASVCGAPPPRPSRFSAPPAKKPTERPLGAQKGNVAPSVPATGCTVVVDRDRSHKRDGPSPEATKTICRPSGDSAKDAGLSVPGVEISRRVSAGVGGGVSRRCRSAGTASAAAATTDAVATSHGARPRAGADDTPVVVALSTADGAAMASSISSRASAASASRRLRSFSRHRRRSVRIAAGVFTGSAVQSGSLLTTAAIVSVVSSPLNARCPVSIS